MGNGGRGAGHKPQPFTYHTEARDTEMAKIDMAHSWFQKKIYQIGEYEGTT